MTTTLERPETAAGAPYAKTPTPRRRFLSQAASVAVGGTAAAVVATQAIAAPDDSALVRLEEQIFEQYEQATAYDDEIIRLQAIWGAESKRLYQASLAAGEDYPLTAKQQWQLVTDMPESREHSRLCNLQGAFFTKIDALVKQMAAIPAHTAEGRRAKVSVLLGCILGDEWRGTDKETDYPELMARNLLIEFVGGEPGETLRSQFA
jgi:hypothetical protein